MYEEMYDDAFLDSLPEEPLDALQKIIAVFNEAQNRTNPSNQHTALDFYMQSVALAEQYAERGGLSFKPLSTSELLELKQPDLVLAVKRAINIIANECTRGIAEAKCRESVMRLDGFRDMYSSFPRNEVTYEFSEDDYTTIQRLTNELRDLIANSDLLSDNHKRRLLSRLEKFQSELHKKMSNLDHFWAFFGEAGPRLGQFGEDVKPLTDRIREMVDIVMRITKIQENLIPDLSKYLPGNVDNSDTDE